MSFVNVSHVSIRLMALIMLLPGIGLSQAQERIIDKISWQTEPVKIIKIRTDRRTVELGKNFLEEDDWLKGLTLTV